MLDCFEDHHRKFVSHILALIEHFTPSILSCEETVTSKLEDILLHSGYSLHFLGKVQEEVQLWRSLLAVLFHQYNKGKENVDAVSVYCELFGALVFSGKIDAASVLLKKGFR